MNFLRKQCNNQWLSNYVKSSRSLELKSGIACSNDFQAEDRPAQKSNYEYLPGSEKIAQISQTVFVLLFGCGAAGKSSSKFLVVAIIELLVSRPSGRKEEEAEIETEASILK